MNNPPSENSKEITSQNNVKKGWSKPELLIIEINGGNTLHSYHEAGNFNGNYYLQKGSNLRFKVSQKGTYDNHDVHS